MLFTWTISIRSTQNLWFNHTVDGQHPRQKPVRIVQTPQFMWYWPCQQVRRMAWSINSRSWFQLKVLKHLCMSLFWTRKLGQVCFKVPALEMPVPLCWRGLVERVGVGSLKMPKCVICQSTLEGTLNLKKHHRRASTQLARCRVASSWIFFHSASFLCGTQKSRDHKKTSRACMIPPAVWKGEICKP